MKKFDEDAQCCKKQYRLFLNEESKVLTWWLSWCGQTLGRCCCYIIKSCLIVVIESPGQAASFEGISWSLLSCLCDDRNMCISAFKWLVSIEVTMLNQIKNFWIRKKFWSS